MEQLLGKNISELQAVAVEAGLPRFVGKQLAQWLYEKRVSSFEQMTNISTRGRQILAKDYVIGRNEPVATICSKDRTRKFLFQVGQEHVETVLIPEDDRHTLCISTQAGCRMCCAFCMTGTLGFRKHLTAAEMLNQILTIDSLIDGGLTNLVLMGEGEPMDNLDEVLRTLTILTAPWGYGWSPKRITVSTVGVMPQLERYLNESDCHLAISLHNPFHSERADIMPAEKAYPIAQTIQQLKQYDFAHQRRLSFEYICWSGMNDTKRHADELLRLLRGLPCRINLIRFHEGEQNRCLTSDGKTLRFPASDEKQMVWLRDYLTDHGITTTIRRSRGEDILAACGMLVNSLEKKI
ncbi:MAG: 23S rRNA (adenine(2503)-C(2))-methyltransferase RlmN [Paludibacteraceae bacterium]|nr:23S rRNA (adenine(2503)-C(2))-methyltransferase RlmN [Paludibacteraceae bacterium]